MKPHRRLLLAFVILALISLRPQIGQAQRPAQSAYDRARASLPEPQRTAFTKIVTTARSRGLPIDPLVDKALEGNAKRQTPDRILAAVRTRSDRLNRAQAIARSKSPVEIIAVADALQRNVSESALRSVRVSARSGEPVGIAVHALADLVEAGVPSDVALSVISSWRARGARPSEVRELPAAVDRLVREGATPAYAGSAVASAVRSGRAASSVRMAIEMRGNVGPGAPSAAPASGRNTAAAARSVGSTAAKPQSAAQPTAKNK